MANDADFYQEYLNKRMLEEGLTPLPNLEEEVQGIQMREAGEREQAQQELDVVPVTPVQLDEDAANEAQLVQAQRDVIGDRSGDGVIKTVAKGLVNGTARAGRSLGQLAIATPVNAAISAYEKMTGTGVDFRLKLPAPAELDTNMAGQLIGGVTQFGIGWYTGGTALKAAKWAQSGTKLAEAVRNVGTGAIADFTAFSADEDRLSNLLIQMDSPILNNAVTQYLATDEDDGEIEGRIKNVAEGGLVGSIVFAAARGIKLGKKALMQGDKVKAGEILEASKKEVADILDNSQESIREQTKDLPDQFDFFKEMGDRPAKSRVVNVTKWDEAQVKETITNIKSFAHAPAETQIKVAKNLLGGKLRVDKLETEQEVRAAMNVMADVQLPKFDTWTHEQQLAAAQARGMDVETLTQYYKLGAVNEHVLLSSEVLLKDQAERVTRMIAKGVDDNLIIPEVMQYQELLNMFASFKNISGRTLDANRIKLELKKGNVEGAQRFMTERFGGQKNFQKFKEAWNASGGDLGEIAALNKTPVGKIIADSALELWKNGLLSGFKTFSVNAVGNVANLYKEIGVRWFQGLAGAGRAALTGADAGMERVYMGESLAMMMAQVDTFVETLQTVGRTVTSGNYLKSFDVPRLGGSDKAELGYMRKISADYWGIGTQPGALARYIEKMSGIPGMKTQSTMRAIVDKSGGIINAPGNLMNVMDEMSQSQARRTQKYALAYRQLMEEGATTPQAMKRLKQVMNDPTFEDNIAESLDEFAKRSTFQTELGPNAIKLQQVIKGWRPLNVPVLEYIIPFIRTPINIFKQGVTEVNPMIAPLSKDFRDGMAAGGIQADEVLGRLAFGTSMATASVVAATSGMITGAGPSDPNLKKALMNTGWRPYSIRVDNGTDANGNKQYKYVGYGRIEPAAWVIGSFATMIETMHYSSTVNPRNQDDFKDYAAAMMSALSEATLDKSFFQGVSQFFQTMADPQRNIQGFVNRYAGSLVPAIVRDVETMMQEVPYLRDIRSAEDAINARLLGQSNKVAVARNRWGDPIEMDEGWFLGARSYFSPIGMSDKYAQPIDLEIKRLALDGVAGPDGALQVFPQAMINMPTRNITRKGMSIPLDSHQYSRLLEIAGKEIKLDTLGIGKEMTMRDALNHLVTKEEVYLSAAPIRQARMIKQVSKGYDKMARDQLFQEYPELREKLEEAERLDIMSKTGVSTPENEFKLLEDISGS